MSLVEKAMATHSSTLAWQIPWMKESGRLQSMVSLGVGHDWTTSLLCLGEGNGNPLQCSCLENPRDEGAWWAAIYGVAQSQTRLKLLSSGSSSMSLVGLPRWLNDKDSACQCRSHRRCEFNFWVRKIPWSRKCQPTPVFLPEIPWTESLAG